MQVPYGSLTLHLVGIFIVATIYHPEIRVFGWQPGDGHFSFAKDMLAKSVLTGFGALDWMTDLFVGWKIVSEVCTPSSMGTSSGCVPPCLSSRSSSLSGYVALLFAAHSTPAASARVRQGGYLAPLQGSERVPRRQRTASALGQTASSTAAPPNCSGWPFCCSLCFVSSAM